LPAIPATSTSLALIVDRQASINRPKMKFTTTSPTIISREAGRIHRKKIRLKIRRIVGRNRLSAMAKKMIAKGKNINRNKNEVKSMKILYE
jgi:hypothetical protein